MPRQASAMARATAAATFPTQLRCQQDRVSRIHKARKKREVETAAVRQRHEEGEEARANAAAGRETPGRPLTTAATPANSCRTRDPRSPVAIAVPP
jgi:hypothetical protein